MMELLERYQRRPIRFLELWQESGWRLKVYSITHHGGAPREELLRAAKEMVTQRWLRQPVDATARHHGVGFLGIHDSRGMNFVFLDWWADESELHHHVYLSPADKPEDLRYVTPNGLAATIWDLRVVCFERQAWIDTVLANPMGPDLEAYLSRRLDEDV